MSKIRKVFKTLLVLILTVTMSFASLAVNTNKVGATSDYSLDIIYGYGRSHGSTWLTNIFKSTTGGTMSDTGYSLHGERTSAYTNTTYSTATGDNTYTHPTQINVDYIEFWYGDQVVNCPHYTSAKGNSVIKGVVYLDGDDVLSYASGVTTGSLPSVSERIMYFAANSDSASGNISQRWWNIDNNIKVIYHYYDENTITVNNIDDTTINTEYDTYLVDKTTPNQTVTTVSGDYSGSGFNMTVTPLTVDPINGVTVTVGSTSANCTNVSGIQYLSSGLTFSNTAAAGDILSINFNTNVITYKVVTTNITVDYSYGAVETHDVTFMNNGIQYGAVQHVIDGELAGKPADPTIPSGYNKFVGWFLEGTDNEFDFNTPITADLVLESRFANRFNFTFTNFEAATSSDWESETGGETFTNKNNAIVAYTDGAYETLEESESNGVEIRFDYNTGIDNISISFGSHVANITTGMLTTDKDWYLDDSGNWLETLSDPTNKTYILKFMPDYEHDNYSFFRVWNVGQDIDVTATLEQHEVKFDNLGHGFDYSSQIIGGSSATMLNAEYIATSEWVSETGGTINKHECVGTTNGDYVDSTGLPVYLYTKYEELDSIVLTFGSNAPLVLSADDLIANNYYYVDKDYNLVTRNDTTLDGDIYKIYKSSSLSGEDAYTIYTRFYKIVENVSIEFIYKNIHTITIRNFGNADHNYIGKGKFAASGSQYSFYAWDPYTGTNNLRAGGTFNAGGGVATIYGDYSSTNGYGAALLIHEDYTKHDKVTIVYNHGEALETVDYITYALDNVNGVNQNWTVGGKKIVQFVQNKNVQYYNLRFYNVEGNITITSSGGVSYSSSLKLNNDGTVSQDVTATLDDFNENYSATVDAEAVPLVARGASLYQIKLSALAPARLIQEREIKILDGSNVVGEKTTSVVEYLTAIIGGDHSEGLKTFAKAMLNYAAYCQVYFDEHTDNLANKNLSNEDKNVDYVTADAANDRSISGSTDGVSFYGQSLNLTDSTTLRVYFQITSGSVSDYVFKDGDTVLTPSVYDAGNGIYYVIIRNVAAPDLAVKHNFTVTKGGAGDLTVSTSVLSYANVVMNKYATSTDQDKIDLVRTMKALYLYYSSSLSIVDRTTFGLKAGAWNNSLTLNSTYDIEQFALPYQIYLPEGYTPTKSYPILLFMHGNGSRGEDNQKQLTYKQICDTLLADPDYKDIIFIAPQYPTAGPKWVEHSWAGGCYDMDENPSTSLAEAYRIFNYWKDQLSTDPDRYYLYGNSQGGYASYELMSRYPGVFAAAVIVAGCGDLSQVDNLKDTPIWIHHGNNDATVPYQGNVDMYNALIAAGSTVVEFTTYDGRGHDIFPDVGVRQDVADWIMAQSK